MCKQEGRYTGNMLWAFQTNTGLSVPVARIGVCTSLMYQAVLSAGESQSSAL